MSQKVKRRLAAILAGFLAVTMLFSLIVSLILPALAVRSSGDIAEEMYEVDAEADEYAETAAALAEQAEQTRQRAQEAIDQKLIIDQAIITLEEDVEEIKAEIQQLNLDIADKQAQLDTAEEAEAEMTERYKTRLRAMEEGGTESYWAVIFRATSLSDLLDQLTMIADISRADQEMQVQLAEARALVEQEQEVLEQARDEHSAKQAELEEKQAQLTQLRAEVDELILELVADNDLLLTAQSIAEEIEAQLREESLALLADYQDAVDREAAASAAASSSGSSSSGTVSASGFMSPLPSGSTWVSCPYGYRYHPIDGQYKFHYGVDLAASLGTAVYATKSGTVVQSTYASINGNYVTIQHADGSSSLYAHLNSATVSAGDYVSQGSLIGYVGTTGYSTGPHLHFEIYIGGSTVNPMEYISLY